MSQAKERLKQAQANNEFYVPAEHERAGIIPNTPQWLRVKII
jgi:hypothetical protein|tara:strand:- start:6192 stop:6317 length:126 start_codon:yes stop_codon:yes gene_type:complete